MVQVSIEHCKSSLEKLKAGKVPHDTYMEQLQNEHLTIESGKVYFKGTHLVQGKRNIDSIKQKYIDAILKKLDETFPANESNPGFDTRSGHVLSFLLLLIQEGQLSVTGESMCTKYWLTA